MGHRVEQGESGILVEPAPEREAPSRSISFSTRSESQVCSIRLICYAKGVLSVNSRRHITES
jgi:hypothetical protein